MATVEKRAEKFIEECTRSCSNELVSVECEIGKRVVSYHEWLTPEQALKAVELAREELIEKVENVLTELLPDIYDFRKAMEG